MSPTRCAAAALVSALALTQATLAQEYTFTFDPALSGVTGDVDFGINANGALIGDWDAETNPSGTRTKPGIIGSFGASENVAVPVSLGVGLGGTLNTQTTGGFSADFNTGLGTVLINDYSANFLSSGPASLGASIALSFDSFRTRNPDSLYIGGFPLELPFGSLDLTELSAVQAGAPGIGTISDNGGGSYSFAAAIPVDLTARISLFGNEIDFGQIPLALALTGDVQFVGDTATLTSVTPLGFDFTTDPGIAFPDFPFDLPTILPPGASAGLIFSLVLDELNASLDAQLATTAIGTLVPAPGASAMLLGVGALATRRRRTSA